MRRLECLRSNSIRHSSVIHRCSFDYRFYLCMVLYLDYMQNRNFASFFQVKINATKLHEQLDTVNRAVLAHQDTIQFLKKNYLERIQSLEMEIVSIRQQIKGNDKQGLQCTVQQNSIYKQQFKEQICQMKKQITNIKKMQESYQNSLKEYIREKENVSIKSMITNKESQRSQSQLMYDPISQQNVQKTEKQLITSKKRAFKIKGDNKKQRLSVKNNVDMKPSLQTIKQQNEQKQMQMDKKQQRLDQDKNRASNDQQKKQTIKQQMTVVKQQVRSVPKHRESLLKMNKVGEMMKALQSETERRMTACVQENNRYITLAKRIEQLESVSNNAHRNQTSRVEHRMSSKNMELVLAMQFKSIEETWNKKMDRNLLDMSKLKDKQELLEEQLQIALRKLQKEKQKNGEIFNQIKKIQERKLDEKLIQSLTGLVKRTQRRNEEAVERKLQIGVYKEEKEQIHESLRYLKEAIGEKAQKQGIKRAFMFLEDKLRDIVTLLTESHGELLSGALNTLPLKCLSCTRDLDSLKRTVKTSNTSRKQFLVKPG